LRAYQSYGRDIYTACVAWRTQFDRRCSLK
jgi:hypothetical protein